MPRAGTWDEAVKPVVKQAETNDLLLPCAAAALFSWETVRRNHP